MMRQLLTIFVYITLFWGCKPKKQASSCLNNVPPRSIILNRDINHSDAYFLSGQLNITLSSDALNLLPYKENTVLTSNQDAFLEAVKNPQDIHVTCTASIILDESEKYFSIKAWTSRHCFYPRAVRKAEFTTNINNEIHTFPIEFVYQKKIAAWQEFLQKAGIGEPAVFLKSNISSALYGQPEYTRYNDLIATSAQSDFLDTISEQKKLERMLLNGRAFYEIRKNDPEHITIDPSSQVSTLVYLWEDLEIFSAQVSKDVFSHEELKKFENLVRTQQDLWKSLDRSNPSLQNLVRTQQGLWKTLNQSDQLLQNFVGQISPKNTANREQLDLVRILYRVASAIQSCDANSFENCSEAKLILNDLVVGLIAEFDILLGFFKTPLDKSISLANWEDISQILDDLDQQIFERRALLWTSLFTNQDTLVKDTDLDVHLNVFEPNTNDLSIVNAKIGLRDIGEFAKKNILINLPYGLVHIFDDDLFNITKGNSGSLLTYKNIFPIAVLAVKDGIPISGGVIRTVAPSYIEPPKSEPQASIADSHIEENKNKTVTPSLPLETIPIQSKSNKIMADQNEEIILDPPKGPCRP